MTRAERRQKQRAANPGRAMKMREERLKNPIPGLAEYDLPRLNIGCSGWFYWTWRGIFYPERMPAKNWFSHYARHFKTVELNAPFYSWPTAAVVRTWLRQAGRRKFTYTVKASELITHVRRFTRAKVLVRDFGYIADILGDRMGCFLYQLPPSFHYTPARLKRIVDQLDPARRNVVEFRHRSWWNEHVYSAFRKAGIIFCSCSGPRLPDELVKTAEEIYLRFHGRSRWYNHDYTAEELRVWAKRIQKARAARIWVYFNNDRNGYAIKNAKMLRKMLAG
jgi:uncharacterized protein YecE (DUF72 family)